ncbi:uncharacterized protein LOC105262464 [Musca domestica]|uniref:Uncharacterized protein LOC105262464 n=2 Tax=Musca domestica TaxID=7370 RepID=A0A9J7DCV4_MUSDO|nr:uncharacterized protein LOC105262464 [Musca domestica]
MTPRIVKTDPNIVRKLQMSHRKSIENAQSMIDMKPTKILATTFLNMNKLKDDFKASSRILKDNIQLLRRINYIQRNHGKTGSYNKYKGQKSTYLENVNRQQEIIKRENLELGRRLLSVTSTMDTREKVRESNGNKNSKEKEKHPLDNSIIQAYMDVTSITDQHLMAQLLRPKIYLDLYIKNLHPLGRLVIQLYTEACPDLVLEFVRLCSHNSFELIKLIRIFPLLWIETELMVENEKLSKSNFEYQPNCLDLSQKHGVLSFSQHYLQGFPLGLLNFTISFKPLPACQRERIPFGIISNGLRILSLLPDYGTKNGKIKKQITVSKCGVL